MDGRVRGDDKLVDATQHANRKRSEKRHHFKV